MNCFPWRFAVCFVLAIYLLADLFVFHGPLHRQLSARIAVNGDTPIAAQVHGIPITQVELSGAMRDHLFRRGEAWAEMSADARKQTRGLVLEYLVNERVIRAFRLKEGINQTARSELVEEELTAFVRQFEQPGGFESRLAMQHLTEKELRQRVKDAKDDEAWIEEKIAHRIAEVTEADARRWFDENGATLALPARHRAAHIYLTSHDQTKPDRAAEIAALHAKLVADGSNFAAIAAASSEDERTKKIGGDLGWFTRERMPEDFVAEIELLTPGQISAPVETQLGWHILRLIERQPARATTLDESRDEIFSVLRAERREAAVRALISELRERSLKPMLLLEYSADVIDATEPE